MSDTPRTDAHYKKIYDEGLGLEYCETELRYWSEQLERELAEATKSIVQECARIIKDAVDHREPASTYADKIKKHFGVEE